MTSTTEPRHGKVTGSRKTHSTAQSKPGYELRDEVLARLQASGQTPYDRGSDRWWFIQCPNHPDTMLQVCADTEITLKCLRYGADVPCRREVLVRALGLGDLIQIELSTVDQLRAALVTSAGLDDIKPPSPLVEGLLQVDSAAWLQGKPGHGKSFIALDMAGCVGTGQPWQGFRCTQGQVLYLVAEGLSGVRQRVRAWEWAMGDSMAGVTFLPVAVQAAAPGSWDAFTEVAASLKPALVVIDTQARVTVGSEENSARDMGVFVDRVEQVRKATGACVLVVHHEGRAGEHMRGSTAIEGAATTIIRAAKTDDMIKVSCVKQKDAAPFDDFDLRLIPADSSAILALCGPSTSDSLGKILGERWLSLWWQSWESEPVAISTLVRTEIVAESTFHKRKFPLIRAGIVVKEGNGNQTKYRLSKDPTT